MYDGYLWDCDAHEVACDDRVVTFLAVCNRKQWLAYRDHVIKWNDAIKRAWGPKIVKYGGSESVRGDALRTIEAAHENEGYTNPDKVTGG